MATASLGTSRLTLAVSVPVSGGGRRLVTFPDRRLRLRSLTVRSAQGGEGGGRNELVRTLLIDNYDSYTYNIFQELTVVNKVAPVVIYNDEWTWEYIHHCLYDKKAFDNIVISPGPGSPMCPNDIGVCLHILRECEDIPILGVCLGHQALGFVHGARIIPAPEPVHGRLSEIQHTGCNLFNHIPSGKNSGFKVVRYHSLVIESESVPKQLVPIAWTTSNRTSSFLETKHPCTINGSLKNINGISNFGLNNNKVLMGVMHSTRPHFGVQFHPESIATKYGRQIFENFKKITIDFGLSTNQELQDRKVFEINGNFNLLPLNAIKGFNNINHLIVQNGLVIPTKNEKKYLKLKWKKIEGFANKLGGSKNIFCDIFDDNNAKDTFWLDSSSTDQNRARFSFMGGKGGPLWRQITFRLIDQRCKKGGHLLIRDANGSVSTSFLKDGFFDFLDKEIQSFKYDEKDFEGLPFGFYGGFVGFLGYGLKVECGASSNKHKSTAPDACLFFADNIIVIDHTNADIYLLSLQDTNSNFKNNQWLLDTEKKLLRLATKPKTPNTKFSPKQPSLNQNFTFTPEKSKTQYLKSVNTCLNFIKQGESYELCLTNQIKKKVGNINLLKLYLNLRERNPAPYAAWLNFNSEKLAVCCSSPERFLKLDQFGILEAKPIKGTISRGNSLKEDEHLKLKLQYSEKDQAENLMIVDLLRNDLGRVCQPGTVHVPKLMHVESYTTVHTMVSTISGHKRSELSPVHCIRAAFPGGSMTGAPKLRSMELLDSIESDPRGVYSGSIGFVSYNGTFDLNIVIRTVVWEDGEVAVGSGGAVVSLSEHEEEYEEMMLKAKAPLMVVKEVCDEEEMECQSSILGFGRGV